MSDSRHWYCLTVMTGSEWDTRERLEKAGASVMLPMMRITKRVHRHKLVDVDVPLWPSYIFAGFTSSPWRLIDRVPTITGAIGSDGEPLLLSLETVRAVDEICRNPLDFTRKRPERRAFRVGDKVKLLRGPFVNHVAEVAAVRRKGVQVLLELFGAIHAVSIPTTSIEQAAA